MDLMECRAKIDRIDAEIVRLFQERMDISCDIADYKQEHGLNVYDPVRERQKISALSALVPEELEGHIVALYSLIMELSRCVQNRRLSRSCEEIEKIEGALETTQKWFPSKGKVACQGVEGAYSQVAAERLFKNPDLFFCKSFEDVFHIIEDGKCDYGVIPLENSTAGSVNKVYDLMSKHEFRIVRSVRVKVDHNLLAKKGTRLEDIHIIYSHEQAINQCSDFLKSLDGVQVIACENTAVAAKMVAESDRCDIAALSSRACISLYQLSCLKASVQNQGNNYTRFICISRNLEIYPGADRTSLMMVLPHQPGSLYRVLSRFYALDLNLIKLESRPIPERNFEFMFYFDLEAPVYSPNFKQLMSELQDISEEYTYFGSYIEVV